MTAAWSEMLPDRSKEDRKRHAQFILAGIGAAWLLGATITGVIASLARLMDESEETV